MILVQILIFVTSLVVSNIIIQYYSITLKPDESLDKIKAIITGDYTPSGKIINIGNLPIYEYEAPNNANKKRMLIGIYDIYGLSYHYPNMMQVIDQVALQNGGFRTILPDFFRGGGWGPYVDPKQLQPWLKRVADWDSVVKTDLLNVAYHYKMHGVEEFAIFGIGWGGKVATLAAKELSKVFKASAVVHPSSVSNKEAVDVKIPMYLMPSLNETDMLPFYEVLQKKFGDKCGHKRFDDMNHGFSGALGNFSDPLIQQRVSEVITTLGSFFDRNLSGTKQDQKN